MFGQGELAAGAAQAVDGFNGHDVRRPNCLLSLGHMPVDDLVQAEVFPEPEPQPDIAERAGIGPAHGAQANPYDVGTIGGTDGLVVGKESELLVVPLAVVGGGGALPGTFLVLG